MEPPISQSNCVAAVAADKVAQALSKLPDNTFIRQ